MLKKALSKISCSKKVKCNQARPTCSRCFELGETCIYSSVKRKPGPPRGSHYRSNSTRSRRYSVRPHHSDSLEEDLSGKELPSLGEDTSQGPSGFSPFAATHQAQGNSPQFASHLRFSPRQVEYLLGCYFDIVQDANPIFSKELFFRRYQSSLCSEDLISAIVIITAKLTGFTADSGDRTNLDAGLDVLLSSSLFEDDLIGDVPSLDQFRKAYLLAFYEFHQFPGHHSWLRVGRVTRMAYRIGLDRLEHIHTLYPDWSTVGDEEIQEWRSLWWCIYRLDTYSNMSSGAPYLIDDAMINTSFVRSLNTQPSDMAETPQELYLPPNLEELAKVLLAALSAPDTLLRNVHNITIATLRQAGLVIRMHLLRSQEGIATTQFAKAERQLATIRLALPTGWLNPRRNAFSNECHADHHARMITIFHLRMGQLLLSIADRGLRDAGEWMISWQRVLEACQNIAAIADQWDSSFCLAVDPAICFTIFTALVFLDLHKKDNHYSRTK